MKVFEVLVAHLYDTQPFSGCEYEKYLISSEDHIECNKSISDQFKARGIKLFESEKSWDENANFDPETEDPKQLEAYCEAFDNYGELYSTWYICYIKEDPDLRADYAFIRLEEKYNDID